MSIRKVLRDLAGAVADEAAQNPEFATRIEEILKSAPSATRRRAATDRDVTLGRRRSTQRRTPAVLDPVALAKQGEDLLRAELASLDLEQLRDVVAEYGMDPGRLVMKWKTPKRVIERIVDISVARARKGDAFLS